MHEINFLTNVAHITVITFHDREFFCNTWIRLCEKRILYLPRGDIKSIYF